MDKKDLVQEYENIRFEEIGNCNPHLNAGEQIIDVIYYDQLESNQTGVDQYNYSIYTSIPYKCAKVIIGTKIGSDFAQFAERIQSLEGEINSNRSTYQRNTEKLEKELNEKEETIQGQIKHQSLLSSQREDAQKSRDEAIERMRFLEGDMAAIRTAIGEIEYNKIVTNNKGD